MTKPSPLQLETIFYPTVSYKASQIDDKSNSSPMPVGIQAFVTFREEGRHFAFLALKQDNEDGKHPFKLEITVFCAFEINMELARKTYPQANISSYIAVNVARILYSGAREVISTTTSRSPHGAANIESVLIERDDVEIDFEGEGEQADVINRIFGSGQIEVEKIAVGAPSVKRAAKALPAHKKAAPKVKE